MAPKKNKLSREELLQKKREAERLRYQRRKNDPQKRDEMREKEKLKYQKKKEKGLRKLVKDMTPREHRSALKKWKEHCTVYRAKRLRLKSITNNFIRDNTPLSDPEEHIPPTRPTTPVPIQMSPGPSPAVVSASLQQRKKEATKRRKKFNRERDYKIACLEKKVEKYKKRLARFRSKNKKNVEDTPKTKMLKMLEEPDQRKEVVKKALFGDVISKQLKENYSTLKRTKERQIFKKVITGTIVQKYRNSIPKEMKSLSIQERCLGITCIAIDAKDIQAMVDKVEEEAADQKGFKGTLNVHQVAGIYCSSILNLTTKCKTLSMKSLSCFCNSGSCEHYKIGSINFSLKSRWTVEEVYTESEPEDFECAKPEVTPMLNNYPQKLLDVAGTSGIQNLYNTGDYVLVKFRVKNVEYRYAAVINQIDEDENDLRVTFLKICDQKVQIFRIDDNDIADVSFDQIVQKLDNPDLILKGKRIFYQFSSKVDVFER